MRRRFISLMMICCFLLSINVVVYADELNNDYWKSKVSDEVLKEISENTEEIDVYIFLNDLNHNDISNKLLENGIDERLYTNRMKFEEVLVPQITQQVIDEYGDEKAFSTVSDKDYINGFLNVNNKVEETLVEKKIEQEIDQFKQKKREIVSELCEESNSSFIKNNNIDEQKIIYNSKYSKILIVKVTPEEIEKYAKCDEVDLIEKYEDIEIKPSTDIIMDQIYASRVCGTKSNGFTGNGIKVGIIEGYNGRFNDFNVHLKGNLKVQCINKANASITKHATQVTTIIAGKNWIKNNKSFEGIVPDATVYQIGIGGPDDLYEAVDKLIDKGVDVINFSAGAVDTVKYNNIDYTIDKLVKENNIIFVCAAGNSGGYISSPGYANNVITVGNLKTVNDNGIRIYNSYSINSTSSYQEPFYLTNKPDISAPGTNFYFFGDNIEFENQGSGTSFSAPLVTGVIAQMLQANPYLKANPTLVKAELLLAANNNVVDYTNNSAKGSNLFRDKTGAGIVDAEDSVEIAKNNNYIQINSLNQGEQKVVATKRFFESQNVRIVMVFDKPNNNMINSKDDVEDIDLILQDSLGNTVASSVSSYNNVEIIEYYVNKTDDFKIVVKRLKRRDNNTATPKISITWE